MHERCSAVRKKEQTDEVAERERNKQKCENYLKKRRILLLHSEKVYTFAAGSLKY